MKPWVLVKKVLVFLEVLLVGDRLKVFPKTLYYFIFLKATLPLVISLPWAVRQDPVNPLLACLGDLLQRGFISKKRRPVEAETYSPTQSVLHKYADIIIIIIITVLLKKINY